VTIGYRVSDAAKVPELRRYALRRLRVPIGGSIVSIVVPDASAWRREGEWVAGVARGGEPPYWSRIWLAAVAAAGALARLGGVAGLDVCDLGCGLGLPGVVAASVGAKVTFVDQEPAALAFALWNARNACTGAAPAVRRMDWATEVVEYRHDLLVLADVSYRSLHHAPLRRQIATGLREDGVVLHVDPLRDESSAFLADLAMDHAVASVERRTSLAGQHGVVRVSLIAKNEALLGRWRDRFGWRDEESPPA
jgi:predicted nicotinamide N-methyase